MRMRREPAHHRAEQRLSSNQRLPGKERTVPQKKGTTVLQTLAPGDEFLFPRQVMP